MTSECSLSTLFSSVLYTHTYTHRNRKPAWSWWNLPIILYFTGPSLHQGCDWNNNHPPNHAILQSLWGGTTGAIEGGRNRDEMVAVMKKWNKTEKEKRRRGKAWWRRGRGKSQSWAPWQRAEGERDWVLCECHSLSYPPSGEITPLIQHVLSDTQDHPSSPSKDMKRSPLWFKYQAWGLQIE